MTTQVNQADMDRAADFLESWEPGPEMTVVKLARAFAAHRHAAFLAGVEAMREAATKVCQRVDAASVGQGPAMRRAKQATAGNPHSHRSAEISLGAMRCCTDIQAIDPASLSPDNAGGGVG